MAVVFFDELGSGVPPAGAADVARDLLVPAGLAAGGMITAFHALAIFVETPLLAWSERLPVRWFSAGALAVLAMATLGAALSGSALVFAICLAVYGPASGCALAASEGLLVEARPDQRERTIARLGLAGALGDLAVPALLAGLAWWGLGWRSALGVAAGVAAVLAIVHASSRELGSMRLRLDHAEDDADEDEAGEEAGDEAGDEGSEQADEEPSSLLETLQVAFTTRPLLLWSIAAALTSWLDELLVALVMVHLEGTSALARALAVGAWTVGVVAGLVVVERAGDRLEPRRVLLGCAAVVAASLVVLALGRDVTLASVALFVLGLATSALHPLASARAYASLPGRPALVNAVAAALAPFDALVPLALGGVAVALGAQGAILLILLAPLGIAIVAWRSKSDADRAGEEVRCVRYYGEASHSRSLHEAGESDED